MECGRLLNREKQHPEIALGTTISAIYENGVFRPLEPIELAEGSRVELLIDPPRSSTPPWTDPKKLARALEQIAALPPEGPNDGFSGADHDEVLYGWKKKP
jgi:predicted DNA-binding antitoxin AbrB/MazE fold protein